MLSVEPDLKLGGFSLWVFGRQFPNSTDYWDGNWLNVRAVVTTPGAFVEIQRPCVRTSDLASFTRELDNLNSTLVGEAKLCCVEPWLKVTIDGKILGHLGVKINITPDHMTQSHEFEFDLDQTYIGPFLSGCHNVLSRWPVLGKTLD